MRHVAGQVSPHHRQPRHPNTLPAIIFSRFSSLLPHRSSSQVYALATHRASEYNGPVLAAARRISGIAHAIGMRRDPAGTAIWRDGRVVYGGCLENS